MKTFRLHLLKKKKNHSHISAFIRFVVSPTPSSSENTTSNSNNDPRPFKSPLAGVPTQKTAGAVSQGERRFCRQTQRVTGPLQRVAGPSLHQRESPLAGGLPAKPKGHDPGHQLLSRSSFPISSGHVGSVPLNVVSIVTLRSQNSCQSTAAGHSSPRQSTAKQGCSSYRWSCTGLSKTQVSPALRLQF